MKNWGIVLAVVICVAMLVTAADNIGLSGQPVGSDQISGIDYLRVKLIQGADGTNSGDTNAALPLPVTDNRLEIARGKVTGLESFHRVGQTINADATATDVWAGSVDTAIYIAPTVARVHNLTSTNALDVTAAGTLTLTGQPANTETVTIDTKVYTFQTVLTDVDGNVLIGAAATNTIDNLIAAINLAAGGGATYAASTTAGTAGVSAVAGAGDTMTLYALTAVATTETAANTAWTTGATAVLGTGARTVIFYGLTSWAATEVSETVNMTGITNAPTTNSYVFVNRMEVASSGTTNINDGIIKATAVSDATVSAYMSADAGISHSAIVGIPSVETLYIDHVNFSILAVGTTDICNFSLLTNSVPLSQMVMFKQQFVMGQVGTSTDVIHFETPLSFPGPCIVKLRVLSDTADSHVSAGFGGILVSN